MSCPFRDAHTALRGSDVIDEAVERCPFLRNVASRMGPNFARQVAARPSQPADPFAGSARRPLLAEDCSDFDAAVRLFHGPAGVVPLKKFEATCDPPAGLEPAPTTGHGHATPRGKAPTAVRRHVGAPLATISLSGGFGPLPSPDQFLRFLKQQQQRGQQQRRMRKPSNGNSGGSGDRVNNTQRPRPQKLSQQQHATGSESGATGGRCPMRKFIEPLGGLIPLGGAALSRLKGMKCPTAIVAARAMVARTQAVRALRPQALYVKMLAIGAFAAAVNLPFGVWRVHTEKFSPAWVLAVHAPVPFIAILRKAVIMPKWAMAMTIGAAILGQAVGARLERRRLEAASAGLPTLTNERMAADRSNSCGGVGESWSTSTAFLHSGLISAA